MSSVVDEIKARLDIVDVVSETVNLRRSGKNYTGFCPFHPNTRTPAFVVFPESGTWRCFGQCNEGGDIFSFVMKKEGWDFAEALRYLAERAGVQLRPTTPQQQEQAEEFERLRALLEDAVIFYRHNLLNTPAGEAALRYLTEKRGLTRQTIETWGLGYAPNAWDATTRHFLKKGYTEEELLQAGLVSQRDSGGVYDRFRHRITFPIRDERGRMAGFGARVLNPDDVPKFLNSPQTVLFDKGKLLYGLDRARKAIRAADQVVIVEGYLDVIALHQAGFENVVSPMGTALTEHHLRLLKKRTRRIVLALDPDAAGDKATLRGLQIARETLDRTVMFDAYNLVRNKARLQADIRVAVLPEDLDPDEVVNRDPDEWRAILAQARPIVVHVMETLAAGRDLNDPAVKTEIIQQVLPLIEDLPDEVERAPYRQRLARLLGVDEHTIDWMAYSLHAERRPPRRRRRKPQPQPALPEARPAPTPIASTQALEAYCLGVLLRDPQRLHAIDRALQQAGLSRLIPQDFQVTPYRLIFERVIGSLEQTSLPPEQYLLDSLPLELMPVADEVLAQTAEVDLEDVRLLDDLLLTVIRIRRQHLENTLTQLRYTLEESPSEEGLRLLQGHLTARARLDHAMEHHAQRALLNLRE